MEQQGQAISAVRQDRLLRLKEVLEIVNVSKSTWWEGCSERQGRFPAPVYLGPKVPRWRESEILALFEKEG